MATTVNNVFFEYSFSGTIRKTNSLGSPTTASIGLKGSTQYDAGTFTKVYEAARTGSEVFDCSTSLTDPCGSSFTFSTVKFIFVRNTHATNALTVNASGSNLLGASNISIPAGQAWLMPCSLTVDSTHKNLVFGTGTYDLFIGG